MSKMKELAALLGVELGERFEVTGYDGVFRLEEDSMRSMDNCGIWHVYAGTALYGVLSGDKRIIKTPWKPKKGEQYWCATTYCGAPQCEWQDRVSDLAFYALGNCFRTEEEAEAHKEEVLSRLKKIYDEGKPLIGADEWRDKECR